MTIISVSEGVFQKVIYDRIKGPQARKERKNKVIIHDGLWNIGEVKTVEQLMDMLSFLDVKLEETIEEKYDDMVGKTIYYKLSKNIIDRPLPFSNIEQLKELSYGRKLKKVKGLSNGKIVDCYVAIGENDIEIFRPNCNVKDIYSPMSFKDEQFYKENNWFL